MNKKNIILIISVVVLIGGIIFWQSSKQNFSDNQIDKNNNFTVNSLKNNQSQRVAENLVEVFYLPHGPIDPIRQKIKSILQKFPEYKLKEYDFYDENNKQKIEDYNLAGHIPVSVFIGGTNTFSMDDHKITFENFPKGDAFAPTFEGEWSYEDLEKILANLKKYQND